MKKPKKRTQTLAQFVKEVGPTMAAAMIGVTTKTLWSWKKKRTTPRGNDARQLEKLGVTVA